MVSFNIKRPVPSSIPEKAFIWGELKSASKPVSNNELFKSLNGLSISWPKDFLAKFIWPFPDKTFKLLAWILDLPTCAIVSPKMSWTTTLPLIATPPDEVALLPVTTAVKKSWELTAFMFTLPLFWDKSPFATITALSPICALAVLSTLSSIIAPPTPPFEPEAPSAIFHNFATSPAAFICTTLFAELTVISPAVIFALLPILAIVLFLIFVSTIEAATPTPPEPILETDSAQLLKNPCNPKLLVKPDDFKSSITFEMSKPTSAVGFVTSCIKERISQSSSLSKEKNFDRFEASSLNISPTSVAVWSKFNASLKVLSFIGCSRVAFTLNLSFAIIRA